MFFLTFIKINKKNIKKNTEVSNAGADLIPRMPDNPCPKLDLV